MEHEPELLTLEAAADVLKVGVPTVESLIGSGVLAAQEEGGELMVAYTDLLDYLRAGQRDLMSDGPAMPKDDIA
jgi:excisionase family DNA binding protein